MAIGLAAFALAGCGGGDDESSACTPPNITGTTFVTSGSGQGKAHGQGQLPSGIPDGMQLDLQIATDNSSGSIFPDDFFNNMTCGKNFSFGVRELDPGTYKLGYNIYDPHSDSSDPLFEGLSTNSFSIVGAEDVAFTPAF